MVLEQTFIEATLFGEKCPGDRLPDVDIDTVPLYLDDGDCLIELQLR